MPGLSVRGYRRFDMFECEKDKVNSLVKAHDESGHRWLGKSNRVTVADLLYPQWYHRAARAHDIAVTGAADFGLTRVTGLGNGHFLFYGFGNPHCVDRICSLIGRKTDDGLDSGFYCCCQNIVCSNNIGLNSLHREELTRRHLFECSRMEDIIHSRHRVLA